MGKKRKGHTPTTVKYGSDDERNYSKEKVPDPQDDSFFEDDIDAFHSNRDKVMLEQGHKNEDPETSSDEEVLPVDLDVDDEDDDEEMVEFKTQLKQLKRRGLLGRKKSDDEDDEEDDQPTDGRKTWGKKRADYYGGDVADDQRIDFSGSDLDDAVLEEEEATAIQKKMEDELNETDFQLDMFKPGPAKAKKVDVAIETTITKDLSKMSKKEKLELLKTESPEFLPLVEDFQEKMEDYEKNLLPIVTAYKLGTLPPSPGVDYIQTKVRLLLNYCMNINFYVMLKAKRTTVSDHPIMKRLLQYRSLLEQLKEMDLKMADQISSLVKQLKDGDVKINQKSLDGYRSINERLSRKKSQVKTASKKKLSNVLDEDSSSSEDEPDELPAGGGGKRRVKWLDDNEEMAGDAVEGEEDDKRGITYEMAKNKGLTPKRKREYRNPRVRHKMKYRKAKIRRRGKIREVRTETQKYSGEISGIRAGIKRSIKLR